jgi:hypothetical protein
VSRRFCLRVADGSTTHRSIDRVFFLPAAETSELLPGWLLAAAGGSHGARDHREPLPLHVGVARGHGRARAVPDHRRAHARLAAALPRRHQHTVRGPRADFQCTSYVRHRFPLPLFCHISLRLTLWHIVHLQVHPFVMSWGFILLIGEGTSNSNLALSWFMESIQSMHAI